MRTKVTWLAMTWLAGSLLAAVWTGPWPAPTTRAPGALCAGELSCAVVVINEVAWGGTRADPTDEWIELANTTPLTIDLAGWRISAVDGSPSIDLTGEIAPYGFYLIERTADTTVADIAAELVCSFGTGLSNAGEQLELRDPLGRVVDTVNAGGSTWPNSAGLTFPYPSMERTAPGAPDETASWVSNNGVVTNGTDATGNPIHGTPRSPNSAYMSRQAGQPNLRVAIHGPHSTGPGLIVSYTLSVRNAGGSAAPSTHLTVTLPILLTFVAQESPHPYTLSNGHVAWSVGDLAPDDAEQIILSTSLSPSASTAFTTTLLASSGVTDLDPCDNVMAWMALPATATTGTPQVVIADLLYDGYQYGDADEAIRLANIGTAPETMSGWTLCKSLAGDLSCVSLPTDTLLPGDRVWLARDAGAFQASFGFAPDIVLPQWPALANTGGALLLRAPDNRTIDTLVYKAGDPAVPGWTGPALLPYHNEVAPETGQILSRRLDERTGLPAIDTDTDADWIQVAADPALGRRVLYPGWDLDPLYQPLSVTETATIIAGIAPDNAFEVIAQTLLRAQRTISIEVYSLRHLGIVEILAEKARAGVQVTVLLEGGPVGVGILSPEWHTQLYACRQIELAGGECWFMVHDTENYIYSRYPYLHAKLLIVDDTWIAVGSQNLTPLGMPSDDKSNGTEGTRGVVLATNAPSVVRRAAAVFALDLDPTHHTDLVRWNTLYPERYGEPILSLVEPAPLDGVRYSVAFSRPVTFTGTFGFEFFTGPEATLRRSDALLGLLARAGEGDRVYVEQLYEYVSWGRDPIADPNLRLQGYIEAARRGARVRILLNGRSFAIDDPHPPAENMLTMETVNELAARERLDLRAAVGNPTWEGIHNKMVLVKLASGEGCVHIGSVNGSEGASKLNREVVLQVRSSQLYTYLERLFLYDWAVSHPIRLPLVTRNYTPPPPPASYLVISEVTYSPIQSASEWVELYNPTGKVIDLSGYKIGDAESPAAYEPMFRFPAGASVPPGAVVVIAVNASQVPRADFEFYESDPAVPNMEVYPGWGHADYPFALRNLGDHVVLLDGADRVVDVVVWGDKTFPGTLSHPGVLVAGASLERYPAARDTNDCAADFRERYPPTPGTLPE